jgi:putative photosynthetic complex assembly protein 2
MAVIALDAANPLGFWAYFILFAARISAKLNLFFGVPRINLEFIPQPLLHLSSYFKQGPVTVVFGLGVTGLSLVTAALGLALFSASTVEAQIGHALLFALCALATLEHWLMVIPLPDAKLWRWMLPTLSTNTKTGQSHEL